MSCQKHNCDWLTCTLCRSGRQSLSTLQRAARRSIEWPTVQQSPPNFQQAPATYTSIDDAFDSVMQYMSTTTRQCKRFHRSMLKKHTSDSDIIHADRFHQQQQTKSIYKNPLQQPEDIHVDVAPGTYAVSAGAWGSDRQHTHVVHVREGESVDMTFGM